MEYVYPGYSVMRRDPSGRGSNERKASDIQASRSVDLSSAQLTQKSFS